MEEMNKVDMGLLNTISSTRGAFDCRAITDVSFVDVSVPTGLQNLHNERCYLVKKSDLDAYMARKEDLEQMNCTPVYGENQRLTAKVKELKAENDDLKEKIKELGVIKSFLEVGNEKWIVYNTELKSRNRNLELENAKLRGELSRADDELVKFYGEHTVEFLYEKHEDGKHVIGWTEVSGEEYELTFLTPERKIHE